MALVE
jgi:hypothetical protein